MGKNVASERVRLGLTQKEWADRLDISESTAYRIERDDVEPTGEVLIRMSQLCGCTSDYLLGLSNERRPSAA